MIPILGPRTAAQLGDNLVAADLDLSAAQIARLDAASAIPLGFPHELLAHENQRQRLAGGIPGRVEVAAGPVA